MAISSLQVNDNDLYATGYIVKLEEGKELLKRDKLNYSFAVDRDRTHTVIQGENLYDIAFAKLGDSREWYYIADANNIENPFELIPGQELIIPDTSKFKLQLQT